MTFLISEEEEGERLDKILAARYSPEQSRSYFQHLIEQGLVLLNGAPVKKRVRPKASDEVEVEFLITSEMKLTPEDIPLDLLYEDEEILAVNKPCGMVVHPAPGHSTGTFANALLYYCKTLPDAGQSLRPGIVHRLDKDTSGVLLAAKTAKAHRELVALFAGRVVEKEYFAICQGNPGTGVLETPFGRHPIDRKKMAVLEEGEKIAKTCYQTAKATGKESFVKVYPVTGRTHQIRVHLTYLNAPILGDPVYGSAGGKAPRLMLHAHCLSFPHPITGKALKISAPAPKEMEKWVK